MSTRTPQAGDPIDTSARHGRQSRRGAVGSIFKLLGIAVAVVVASTLVITGITAWRLASNLGPGVDLVIEPGETPPALGPIDGPVNILLVGSDSGGGNKAYGERGETLNDVTILLHISPDSHTAIAVSFPRDMFVEIPSCPDGKGGSYSSMSSQKINNALYYGGLACPVLTVEHLTGLDIGYAAQLEFDGAVAMSSAVGGVQVCIASRLDDRQVGLHLDKGTHTLSGAKAVKFLRSRYGIDNGSDLSRISNQQVFLSALIRKVKSPEVLGNPLTLYQLAEVTSKNMKLSKSLNRVDTMVSMALALKDIPLDRIVFTQYPTDYGQSNGQDGVLPRLADAQVLMDAIKADKAVVVKGVGGGAVGGEDVEETPSETPDPDATEAPEDGKGVELPASITGQPASERTCSAGSG